MTDQYVSVSFDDLVASLREKLAQKPSWKGLTDSSTVTLLLEAIAYAAVNTQYYLQRVFEEVFIDSAQFWESLVRLGNLIGYKVKRPQGALATLKIYSGSEDVTIPAGTVVKINDYDFYFPSDVVVPATEEYVEVTVRQGTKVTYNFTVTESRSFISFQFGNEKTTDTDLKVYVDEVEWTVVDYVLLREGQSLCEVVTLPDKRMELRFGTPSTGIPLSGQTITIECYEVEGSAANYYGDDPEFDGQVLGLTAEVVPPITGGGDLEDEESLRVNIPTYFRLVSGFVAKRDYERFVEGVPGVLKAKALDVKDGKQVPFRTVRIYVLPEGGYEIGTVFKTQLENYLNEIIPAGVQVEIRNPLVRDVKVGVSVKLKQEYDGATVLSNVRAAIENLYKPENVDFGEWISISTIRQTALGVSGVKDATVYYPVEDITTMKDYEICRLVQLDVAAF